jgi:hypothetical protein
MYLNTITTTAVTSSLSEGLAGWANGSSRPLRVDPPVPVGGSAEQPPPPAQALTAQDGDGEPAWERINRLINALSTDVMRSDDPGPTAASVLARLRQRILYGFETLYGRRRLPTVSGNPDPVHRATLEDLWGDRDPA